MDSHVEYIKQFNPNITQQIIDHAFSIEGVLNDTVISGCCGVVTDNEIEKHNTIQGANVSKLINSNNAGEFIEQLSKEVYYCNPFTCNFAVLDCYIRIRESMSLAHRIKLDEDTLDLLYTLPISHIQLGDYTTLRKYSTAIDASEGFSVDLCMRLFSQIQSMILYPSMIAHSGFNEEFIDDVCLFVEAEKAIQEFHCIPESSVCMVCIVCEYIIGQYYANIVSMFDKEYNGHLIVTNVDVIKLVSNSIKYGAIEEESLAKWYSLIDKSYCICDGTKIYDLYEAYYNMENNNE